MGSLSVECNVLVARDCRTGLWERPSQIFQGFVVLVHRWMLFRSRNWILHLSIILCMPAVRSLRSWVGTAHLRFEAIDVMLRQLTRLSARVNKCTCSMSLV